MLRLWEDILFGIVLGVIRAVILDLVSFWKIRINSGVYVGIGF